MRYKESKKIYNCFSRRRLGDRVSRQVTVRRTHHDRYLQTLQSSVCQFTSGVHKVERVEFAVWIVHDRPSAYRPSIDLSGIRWSLSDPHRDAQLHIGEKLFELGLGLELLFHCERERKRELVLCYSPSEIVYKKNHRREMRRGLRARV